MKIEINDYVVGDWKGSSVAGFVTELHDNGDVEIIHYPLTVDHYDSFFTFPGANVTEVYKLDMSGLGNSTQDFFAVPVERKRSITSTLSES